MHTLPRLAAALLLLALTVGPAVAQEFTLRGPGEVRGNDSTVSLRLRTFHDGDAQVVRVWRGASRVRVRIGTGSGPRWFRIESDGPRLTPADADAMRRLIRAIGPARSPLEDGLVRVLNLLASWPAGLPVAASLRDGLLEAANGRWRVSGSTEDIGDICGKMNGLHTGSYPVNLIPRGFEALVGPYPWAGGDCAGRCGAGCVGDGPPNNAVFVFSQDCFNHDTCVGDQGLTDLDCNLIFPPTFDDFLYGPSCQKNNVDLAVNGQDGPVVVSSSDPIQIGLTLDQVPSDITVDYWLYAQTAVGIYWLDGARNWVLGPPVAARTGEMVSVSDRTVYQGPLPPEFPPGSATFYISVDLVPDGLFGGRQFEDAVDVTVVGGP